MKRCNAPHCPTVCDFCRMFNYNGREEKHGEHMIGVCIYKGYCVLHEKRTNPESSCPEFICINYKDETEKYEESIDEQKAS